MENKYNGEFGYAKESNHGLRLRPNELFNLGKLQCFKCGGIIKGKKQPTACPTNGKYYCSDCINPLKNEK